MNIQWCNCDGSETVFFVSQVLLTTQGSDLVSKLLKMQQLEDEEELAYNAASQDHDPSMYPFYFLL